MSRESSSAQPDAKKGGNYAKTGVDLGYGKIARCEGDNGGRKHKTHEDNENWGGGKKRISRQPSSSKTRGGFKIGGD